MKTLVWRAQKRAGLITRIVAVIAVLTAPLAVSSSASAVGALASPTWSVMDARTNIQGNRYDYGFTTATTGTVSRVAATVPAGTTGNNRYLALNGVTNNNASTPDSTDNSTTGDLDIRVTARLPQWQSTTATQWLLSKWSGTTQRSYGLWLTNGRNLALSWSTNGSTTISSISGATIPFANDTIGSIRATLDVDNGSGGYTTTFYTQAPGATTWTLFDTGTTTGVTSVFDSTAQVEVGSLAGASGPTGNSAIYYADFRNSLTGTTVSPSGCASSTAIVNCFDPSNDAVGGSSWASTGPKGETWTVNRTGTNAPADIASDLSVMNVSGLAAGGKGQLREIDGTANYTLPTPTSTPSSTAIKLGLAGMTNSYTVGSPTSTVSTLTSTSAAIDSGATNSVAFTAPTINAYSASPTVLQAATPATSVDTAANGIGINGSKLLYTDSYANTANYVDTSSNQATRLMGNGILGSTNGATALVSNLNTPVGIVQDSSGNTYILDSSGTKIRKIVGGVASDLVTSGLNAVGMTIDGSDNIYIANRGYHAVDKMDTAGNLTIVAGTGSPGSGINASSATSSSLNNPNDVAVDSTGTYLYIADTTNNRVLQVTIATSATTVFAGGGGAFADGGSPTATSLSLPRGVAVDTSGNVFISDTGNNRVRKVSGGVITTIAGTGTAGFSGDGGAATSAVIRSPTMVRVDGSGKIYFIDRVNQRIRVVTGTTISTFVGTGQSSWTGDGGNVSKAHFYLPSQMHSDGSGNLYVADPGNNAIRKIDQFGTVSTVAGLGPMFPGSTGDGASAITATLSNPIDVVPDNSGNLYISDYGNASLRVVNSSGNISTLVTGTTFYQLALSADKSTLYGAVDCRVVTINKSTGVQTPFAGTGTCGTTSGDFGPATAAVFGAPRGLATDALGNVFIGDDTKSKVRRVDNQGIITTVAGGASANYTDGSSNLNRVSFNPYRLASDDSGNIYDVYKYRVSRLGGNGTAVTLAGTTVSGYSGDGASAPAATFTDISGTAVNLGNLYISDDRTQTIRVVAQQTATVPLVNNDTMSVAMNTNRQWPILSNDWSRSNEMDPSSVVVTTQPTHGTVTISNPTTEGATLQAVYAPTTSYTGSDSFTYAACDTTRVQCATAIVSITVGAGAVQTAVGGINEGTATNISFTSGRATRYRNYIFYTDSNLGLVRRYDIYSKQSVVVAGNATYVALNDGGPATNAGFNTPKGVTTDPSGTLYVADTFSSFVRAISTAGVISSLSATVSAPTGITLSQTGTVIVTSSFTLKSWNGSAWVTFAGSTSGSSGNGGPATSAQLTTPSALVTGPNGDIYVSDNSACVVRRISGGNIYAFAGTSGSCSFSGDGGAATSATLNGPQGLSVDGSGTILIADFSNNKIRKVTTGGTISSSSAVFNGFSSEVVAGQSTDFYTVNNNFIQYADTSNAVTTLAGTSGTYYSGESTLPLQTQYTSPYPSSLAVDDTGIIYFAGENSRIQKYDPGTGLVTTVVGTGSSGYGANIIGSGPRAMALDGSNRPVFIDLNNNIVRRIDGTGAMTTIAGTQGQSGFSGDGGQATSAKLSTPNGVAYGPDGSLYISDATRVRKVAPDGTMSTIAGTGTAGYTGDGGLATAAQLNTPGTLAVDQAGNLYINDKNAYVIRKIDTSGYISTVAGNNTYGSPTEGAKANATSINSVDSVVVDKAGNLFLPLPNSQKIYKVDVSTGNIATIIGSGTTGFVDNSTLLGTQMNTPRMMSMQKATGNLYFVDRYNSRIRVASGVGSTANVLTSAGWKVSPIATGHTNLRETFSATANIATTSSKLTATLPTSFAAVSPSVIETYGITGTVSASVSGTMLTLSFPSQAIGANVPIAVSFESVTNGGSNGTFNSSVTLYDGAGTSSTGWATTNTVIISASGAPAVGAPGYSGILKRSLSTTLGANSGISVSPAGTTDSTGPFTITSTGSVNNSSVTLTGTSIAISAVTADTTTSVASASFGTNKWGVQLTTSTGALTGASGSGLYSGLSSTASSVSTGTTAANQLTVTPRAKVNYLQPAGTYRSTLTWRYSGGS